MEIMETVAFSFVVIAMSSVIFTCAVCTLYIVKRLIKEHDNNPPAPRPQGQRDG